MAAVNYQWSSLWMDQPRVEDAYEQINDQLAKLTRTVDALESQSIQNTYYQPQNNYTSNYYYPGGQNHSSYSWDYNQSQYFVPELSYSSEFSYQPQLYEFAYEQPPPQQEEISNLEDVFAKFMVANEERMSNQDKLMSQLETEMKIREAQIRNIQNQVEQLANVINSFPQDTLPSDIEIYLKEEGKELCEADTIENGKELHMAKKVNLKRSRSDEDDDDEVEKKMSKVWEEEEKDEDDQALNSKCFKKNSMVPSVQQFQNYEEYNRVDFVEEYSSDEFKFGGGSQFCNDAMEIKEKMKRRHEKIIFAIEPD